MNNNNTVNDIIINTLNKIDFTHNSNAPLPYFAYLFINPDVSEKIKTEISYSDNPQKDLTCINDKKKCRLKMKNNEDYDESSSNNNNAEIELWYLHMIIGPFQEKNEADSFQKNWKDGTRGIESRINKGIELALSLPKDKCIFIYVKDDIELKAIREKYKHHIKGKK